MLIVIGSLLHRHPFQVVQGNIPLVVIKVDDQVRFGVLRLRQKVLRQKPAQINRLGSRLAIEPIIEGNQWSIVKCPDSYLFGVLNIVLEPDDAPPVGDRNLKPVLLRLGHNNKLLFVIRSDHNVAS